MGMVVNSAACHEGRRVADVGIERDGPGGLDLASGDVATRAGRFVPAQAE